MDVCLVNFIYWSCCSNFFVNRVGVYMLTEPHGLNYITSCEQEGFHTHPKEPPLYEVSSHMHVWQWHHVYVGMYFLSLSTMFMKVKVYRHYTCAILWWYRLYSLPNIVTIWCERGKCACMHANTSNNMILFLKVYCERMWYRFSLDSALRWLLLHAIYLLI